MVLALLRSDNLRGVLEVKHRWYVESGWISKLRRAIFRDYQLNGDFGGVDEICVDIVYWLIVE